MSANKTVKALLQERDELYAEVRRLQSLIHLGESEPTAGPDWTQAPPGATHALEKYRGNVMWLKLGKGREPAYRWNKLSFEWVKAYRDSAEALASEFVTARPAKREPVLEPPHVQLSLSRGQEQVVARVSIHPDVTLAEVYDTAANALYQLTTAGYPKVRGGTQ